MRARAPFALSLCFASALAAYACSDGTFPSALPHYDPDAGPPISEDSAVPGDAASADGEVGDGSAEGDSGDASVIDGSVDGGDSEAPHDASDAG